MTQFIYIHQKEQAQSFTRLPNFLFESLFYQKISNEAKILYAYILRRTDLSRKNGWTDEYDRIYLYYPIEEVAELIHCGRQKAVDTLWELQYNKLIEIKRQGCGKPNCIYPKNGLQEVWKSYGIYKYLVKKYIYILSNQSYISYFQ